MCAQVDALRLRLEEKEALLSKKSQQISEVTEEKSTQQGEITDLKDMLDVKERKVNVLQKKVRRHRGRAGAHTHNRTQKNTCQIFFFFFKWCQEKP